MKLLLVINKNIIVFLLGISILFFSIISNEIIILLFLFYFYSIFIINTYKNGSLSDPRLLLVGFFTFYSTFYAISVYITGISVLEINYDLIALSLKYQLFGLFIFISSLNLIISNKELSNTVNNFTNLRLNYSSEKLIFIVLSIIVFLGIFFAFKSGATTKIEGNRDNPFKTLADFSFWILTAIAIIRYTKLKSNIFYDFKLIFFIFIALFYMLVTGERDVFFRISFVALLVYFDKKQNANFTFILLLLFSVAVLVPISQGFKAILLSGSININQFGFASIFTNEFLSAGRNFYSLLLYNSEQSISYFVNDILRAFLPGTLLSEFNIQSTGNWFHTDFRVQNNFSGTVGWGFSLVGEGYLIGGIFGIMFIVFLYALVIGTLYNMRLKSIYWYVFYLLAFATSIYVLRADMANFLSQTIKIGGLSVFSLFIIHKFFIRIRKKNEITICT